MILIIKFFIIKFSPVSGILFAVLMIKPAIVEAEFSGSLKLNFLFISSALYMFGMLGWVGHDRYMVPSLIYLAIYFGIGVMVCKKKTKNINFN